MDIFKISSSSPLWKEQLQALRKLRDLNFEHWLHNNLFSVTWWLMLILFVTLWVIWWKGVDRNRMREIVTYGLMISLAATVIDVIGVNYVLWEYPIKLLPIGTPLIITDYCLLPVVYMLMYQRYEDWKSFIVSNIVLAIFLAFVAEPIAVWLDIFQLNNWKHYYDIPMYFILALSLRWISCRIK